MCWRAVCLCSADGVCSSARARTLFFGQSLLTICQNFQSLGPASRSALQPPRKVGQSGVRPSRPCVIQQLESGRLLTSSVHLFNKYLLNTNLEPGTVLDTGSRAGSKPPVASRSLCAGGGHGQSRCKHTQMCGCTMASASGTERIGDFEIDALTIQAQ